MEQQQFETIGDQIVFDVKQHTEEFLWPVLISLVLIAGGMRYGRNAKVSRVERIIAYWYLWNGVWIHLFLDVGIGLLIYNHQYQHKYYKNRERNKLARPSLEKLLHRPIGLFIKYISIIYT